RLYSTSCVLRSLADVSVAFFFQAEDGIRDRNVTGVQTCALPIYEMSRPSNCVNRPKNKVRNQAIIVNIIIHINSRSVLLIIKLTRDTGIVKIFFIVFSTYSRLKR